MLRLFSILLLAVLPSVGHTCTAVAVGRGATVDGSTITASNVDSSALDTRMAYIPPQDHAEGSMRPVFASDGLYPRYVGVRSVTYDAQKVPEGMQNISIPIGFIPQVKHTYGYWEGCYPFMNEKGVGMGESSGRAKITAKRKGAGGTALFYMDTLMAIALERCDTARCAIKTMGYWGEVGGFYGEDEMPTEAGEIVTVVDGKEAWVFHMMADFKGGAVWAAQRVPDTHAAVSANSFIIRGIDFKDHSRSNFMWSEDILATSQQLVSMGAPKSCSVPATFDFLRCFGADIRTEWYDPGYGAQEPDPWYTTLRMWRVQQILAPSLQLKLTDNVFDLPFSFPVDKPVDVLQAMDIQRDQLQGTEYDLAKGAMAGPYGDPNRNEGGEGMVRVPGFWPRAISLMRTAYSVVCQSRHDRPDIAWIATHQPATSVYVPFFAASTACHTSYMRGWQGLYDEHSAWWTFSFVSNWMRLNWKGMYDTHVAEKLRNLQTEVAMDVGRIMRNFTNEQIALQGHVVEQWHELGRFLVMVYNNGMANFPSIATGYGYPEQWLKDVGFRRTLAPLHIQPLMSTSRLEATSSDVHMEKRHSPTAIGFLAGCLFSAGVSIAYAVFSHHAKDTDIHYKTLSA